MEDMEVVVAHSDRDLRRKISIKVSRLDSVQVSTEIRKPEGLLEEMSERKPDVLLLGVELGEVSGLDLLDRIMRTDPVPTLIIAEKGEWKQDAVKAFSYGAIDFISPENSGEEMKALLEMASEAEPVISDLGSQVEESVDFSDKIVAIGASTGGPGVVEYVLKSLPGDFPAPIVVAQHMSEEYTSLFADRVDKIADINVLEPEDGEVLEEGSAYISPGDRDMWVERSDSKGRVKLEDADGGTSPSIDRLFKSVAEEYGSNSLGVVLSGMGSDGAVGARYLKSESAKIIVQDENSTTVYGIGSHVVDQGDADYIEPAQDIPRRIMKCL